MDDLHDLYQDLILDHARRPHNRRAIESPDRRAEGNNPLCGDRLRVDLSLDDGRIGDIAFDGTGCAISTASASMMTDALRGRTTEEAREIFRRFHALLAGEVDDDDDEKDLGELASLAGVRRFPMRVKCATLAWHTFDAALKGTGETTTE